MGKFLLPVNVLVHYKIKRIHGQIERTKECYLVRILFDIHALY